jgi:hypothetical protein
MKRVLDLATLGVAGMIQYRHPCEFGGAYFLFSAVMSQLSVFVSAYLYSQYYVPPVGDALDLILSGTAVNFTSTLTTSTNSSVFSLSLSNVTSAPIADAIISPANAANYTSTAAATAGKIDPHTLVALVVTLFAVWAIAVVGLSRTIKPAYRRTFLSAQTGSAYAQSYFLDNDDDATRIEIFGYNERQWRAIRARVKEWVLGMYATWQALKPAWLTDAIRALIPDDFVPAETLQQENARAGGRRSTLRQRMSLALGSNTIGSESDAQAISPIGDESGDGAASSALPSPTSSPATMARLQSTYRHAEVVDVESDSL